MKPSIVIRGGAAVSADLGSSSSYSNEIVYLYYMTFDNHSI